jgi:hypothetical protein
MGKRSNFTRRPQDKYLTWHPKAVDALAPHLPVQCKFWEPCAGAGHLVDGLQSHGAECVVASDITPDAEGIYRVDAMGVTFEDINTTPATHIITNPVWSRDLLHQMIIHFSDMRPTWLLFDADWIHTVQAAPYLTRLVRVLSVGRMRWIEGSPHTGKDNVAWYLFDVRHCGPIEFVGRTSK